MRLDAAKEFNDMTMRGNKEERVSWESPDAARRRAVAVRHFREWVIALATFYAAFGHHA